MTAPIDIISLSLSTVAGAVSYNIDSLPLDIRRKFPELIKAIRRQCVKAQNNMSRLDDVLDEKLREYLE